MEPDKQAAEEVGNPNNSDNPSPKTKIKKLLASRKHIPRQTATLAKDKMLSLRAHLLIDRRQRRLEKTEPEQQAQTVFDHSHPREAKGRSKVSYYLTPVKKQWPTITGAILLVSLATAGIFILVGNSSSHKDTEVTTKVLGDKVVKPEFQTVAPDGQNGGDASSVKYDTSKKVATYTDKIDGVGITVSEQILPDSFKKDSNGELEKLAETIYANELIQGADFKAYAGVSIKGPETIVTVKKGLLIFIFSGQKISSDSIGRYITNLK
jgi:hypothetical protein